MQGLSPLARGNPDYTLSLKPRHGPIPARAGQPQRCQQSGMSIRAYPRSRGATGVPGAFMPSIKGLSPLARGNPSRGRFSRSWAGPIPARAGQPMLGTGWIAIRWAYPRSRGATAYAFGNHMSVTGLSPLARGNR